MPELASKDSFQKDKCNPFLQDPCRKVKAGSRCPAEKGSKFNYVATFPFSGSYCRVWQYRLWSFQPGGTKLERFMPKNQHTQRKLLNFENWVIGHHFRK